MGFDIEYLSISFWLAFIILISSHIGIELSKKYTTWPGEGWGETVWAGKTRVDFSLSQLIKLFQWNTRYQPELKSKAQFQYKADTLCTFAETFPNSFLLYFIPDSQFLVHISVRIRSGCFYLTFLPLFFTWDHTYFGISWFSQFSLSVSLLSFIQLFP